MKPLQIGVIGCGGIARAHLKAYSEVGGSRLSWVYDVSPQAAAALAAEYGAEVAPSVEWMAREAGLDAVSVCTPPGAHVASCLPLVEAGVAVLCEKPLAATLEQAEVLAQAVQQAGALFMVAYCHRFHPPIVRLKELIDAGTLGEPLYFLNTFSGLVKLAGNHRAAPELSGGGCLMDNGAHAIDLLRHLVGEPTTVQAMAATAVQDAAVEDLSAVQLRVGSAMAQIMNCYSTPACTNRVEWVGDRGAAVVSYFAPGTPELVYRLEGQSAWTSVDCSDLPSRFVGEVRHFVDCVRGGGSPRVTAEDGLRTSLVVAKAYESARQGGSSQPIPQGVVAG